MAVLGVFFATFATVVSSSIRHGSEIQEEAVLQTEVRASVDTLVADLRQATSRRRHDPLAHLDGDGDAAHLPLPRPGGARCTSGASRSR